MFKNIYNGGKAGDSLWPPLWTFNILQKVDRNTYSKCSDDELPVPWKHTETHMTEHGTWPLERAWYLGKSSSQGSKLKQQQMRPLHCVMKDAGIISWEQECHD